MPLKFPRYTVALAPLGDADDPTTDPVVVECTVINGDQLRAELEGPRHGLQKMQDAPLHYTTLWVWASLVRTGDYTGGFREFKDRCLYVEPATDANGEAATETVDPTPPGTGTASA